MVVGPEQAEVLESNVHSLLERGPYNVFFPRGILHFTAAIVTKKDGGVVYCKKCAVAALRRYFCLILPMNSSCVVATYFNQGYVT